MLHCVFVAVYVVHQKKLLSVFVQGVELRLNMAFLLSNLSITMCDD